MLYSTSIDTTTKLLLQEIEGGRKRKQGRTKIAGNRGGGVKRTVPLSPGEEGRGEVSRETSPQHPSGESRAAFIRIKRKDC
jgi:hypothetical protein